MLAHWRLLCSPAGLTIFVLTVGGLSSVSSEAFGQCCSAGSFDSPIASKNRYSAPAPTIDPAEVARRIQQNQQNFDRTMEDLRRNLEQIYRDDDTSGTRYPIDDDDDNDHVVVVPPPRREVPSPAATSASATAARDAEQRRINDGIASELERQRINASIEQQTNASSRKSPQPKPTQLCQSVGTVHGTYTKPPKSRAICDRQLSLFLENRGAQAVACTACYGDDCSAKTVEPGYKTGGEAGGLWWCDTRDSVPRRFICVPKAQEDCLAGWKPSHPYLAGQGASSPGGGAVPKARCPAGAATCTDMSNDYVEATGSRGPVGGQGPGAPPAILGKISCPPGAASCVDMSNDTIEGGIALGPQKK